MPKTAVFFDLGGTLMVMRRDVIISSILSGCGYPATPEQVHAAYFRVEPGWLSAYGSRDATRDQVEESYRVLDSMVFDHLFPGRPRGESTHATSLMRTMWDETQRSVPLKLYPDAEPTLRRLKDEGYKLALVSNAPSDTSKTVESLGLSRYISVTVFSGAVGVSKPNPEIFRIALRKAAVEPSEALHVGDLYEADVAGARNAGVDGVLIDREGNYGATDCLKIAGLDEVFGLLG
ncbi:MAG: HAD-IA family hydrolase [Nitrososphaerota archaeon]|nr:HAD-IA family hydrolase [Nitrososphaerota archaeon]